MGSGNADPALFFEIVEFEDLGDARCCLCFGKMPKGGENFVPGRVVVPHLSINDLEQIPDLSLDDDFILCTACKNRVVPN